MEMISSITAGRLKPSAKITGTEEVALKRQSEEKTETQSRPLKPVRDEYLPEEKQDPNGCYRSTRPEICRGSTDKVDREIEKLKKEQKELEQKLNSETDEMKIKELENRLNEVERELRQKDNDTYRRQHTVFS